MKSSSIIRLATLIAVISMTILACEFTITSNQFPEISVEPTRLATKILKEQKPAATFQPASGVLQQVTVESHPLITTNEEEILVELYQSVNPAVVNINTYIRNSASGTSSALGSGFLFDDKGNIVTNSHVISNADRIEVVFSDGFIEAATLVGDDPHSDLAVIHVEKLPADVQPIPLGSMDEVAVGQTAVALGNPFGLGGTLTRGIISAMGRSIPALTSFSIPQAIQTDAPINPGNSGGPLLNLAGQVIGVNAQIETGSDNRSNSGVGFAIPVSIVSRVVPTLIEKGSFEWSWLGVVGGNLTPTLSKAMKLEVERGAYLSEVTAGGPAEKAGLRGASQVITIDGQYVDVGGDVIVGIDGTQVNSFEDLLIYVALNTKPGQQVLLTIFRDGKMQETYLTLQARPNNINQNFNP